MNCGYKSSINLRLSLRRTTAIPPAETRRSEEISQLDKAQQETTECGRIETERVNLFNQLLNLRERYRRVNQYECVIEV